jgi:serine/threonine protein kinase
MFKIPQ